MSENTEALISALCGNNINTKTIHCAMDSYLTNADLINTAIYFILQTIK